MAMTDGPLPDFNLLVGECSAALEEIDMFDLDSTDPASVQRMEELDNEYGAAAAALVRYVLEHGPALLIELEQAKSEP